MKLEAGEFYDNCQDIFGNKEFENMVSILNNEVYKSSKYSFDVVTEANEKGISIHNNEDEEIISLKSFHDLEKFFIQTVGIIKITYSDPCQSNDIKLEDFVRNFISTLFSVVYSKLGAPKEIMPEVCKVYKGETAEIMTMHRSNFIAPAILGLYDEDELGKAEECFGIKNLNHLFALISASPDEKIDLDKLCKESIPVIKIFIEETSYKDTLRALNTGTSSFKGMLEDWRYRSRDQHSSNKLIDYIK